MNDEKVGIVTFHTALNYGAILQTYALQNFLSNLNINNEIINYDCDFIKKCYSPFFVSNGRIINSLIRGILFTKTISKRKKNFKDFTDQNLVLSKKYNNIEKMKEDISRYKYFISGSDQVWSPISANFDEFYFLPFANSNQKFSYAASIGSSKLSDDEMQILKERLKDFKFISVREESAKDLIKKLDDSKEILVNADPTLLLSKQEWNKIIKTNVEHEKYLLIFNVEKPINDIVFAKKIAKQKGLKIKYINDRTIFKDKDIQYIEAPTPSEFVTLFANAELVVTNSFHGTVFSIIFEKEFYVEYENHARRNIRSEALVKKLKIGDREIKSADTNKEFDIINWNEVNNILKEERKKSESYIKRINQIGGVK